MTNTIQGRRIDGSLVELNREQLVWRPSAYALIFDAAGHILLLDNTYNGKKDLPGGGVEIHERLTEGLLREVWEETGLTVTIAQLVYADDNFVMTPSGKNWHTVRHYYRAHVTGGTLRSSIIAGEHTINPRWLDPHPLQAADFTSGYEALALALAAGIR
ncbi:MAG TPA: NUDIX domain-containing protein [Phototrophicaceae bacterium]|nr:NUDIX domain-containing protein [Phototrophicaceae bacterium]